MKEQYIYIHKHIKNVFMIGNYELEEVSILLISVVVVYIFQEQLKLGFMGLIIYLGYLGMLWLHELKATSVKSFKYHLAYKFGFKNSSKFPKSYIREFTGN
ncbi:hypothetical protein SDC9_11849 [bioreactor metagenome]|uniref:Uncharacterized protein n=1 Tax=bioreactor metagenome TaxID=1076179 RepID=A0A644TH23_9ZZZZ|nr:hypothetical protein [Aliarcobacter butzleri]MCG3663229.1 hypothetical protein [Aliarcobacter butzleri]MCT7536556.1 hypothetical protein [Aliarcobacter butzleri]MCT7623248.1 hypothetical protein [Aliarcobacter butzleri]MDN5117299.1 hypothetical protein [Aliarcobacter butzleri]